MSESFWMIILSIFVITVCGWSLFVHFKYSNLYDKIIIDKKRNFVIINKKQLNLRDIKDIAIENFNPMSFWEKFSRLDWYYQFSKLVFIKKDGKVVKCIFNNNWKLYNTLKKLPIRESSYEYLKEDLFDSCLYYSLSKMAVPGLAFLIILMLFCIFAAFLN